MAIQIDKFEDGTAGTMRSMSLGNGVQMNFYDITDIGDVSAIIAVPTTLSKVIYASGYADPSAGCVTSLMRAVTAYSLCTTGGPWVNFLLEDVSAGTANSLFHAFAVGW